MHLSPKAFDLLLTLIAERPGVVSKAALHARLWPQTYVSDASLATLVAEIRTALGDRTPRTSAIRTVHGRGYAFQAVVRPDETRVDHTAPEAAGHWLVTPARQVPLPPGDHLVGRDPQARVWLDVPSVSRRHARIRVAASGVTVMDLRSKNGTRVGGRRVKGETALTHGDSVAFGSVTTEFRAWTPGPTRTEDDTSCP